MKNIVVVTWKGGGNFGTCLQSYALYRKLMDLGFSVRFLTGIPQKYSVKLYIKWILSIIGIKHIRKGSPKSIQQIKRERFQQSCYKDIVLYTKYQEYILFRDTDCFITGSDQIWNTYYDFNPYYFLSFAKDKKRVAYASSIGTNSIKEDCKEEVRELLLRFSHIGVREKQAVNVLNNLTGRTDICQVLDPTFLLKPEDWTKMSMDAEFEINIPQRYILCYLIGNNEWYEDQLQDVITTLGIDDIIIIPAVENPNFKSSQAVVYENASPVEFIWLLQHATFVCTDSFHATALSINNSIPFVEFMRFQDTDKQSQNSRIYDLLTHYGLLNRIYTKGETSWTTPIEYNAVQKILSNDRESSLGYLVNAINN